jgi:hypothetical protein
LRPFVKKILSLLFYSSALGIVYADAGQCAAQCGYYSCAVYNTKNHKRYERESSISQRVATEYALLACRREAGQTAEKDCSPLSGVVCIYASA